MTRQTNSMNQEPFRLGVVSFLNSRPLIEGLEDDPRVVLQFAVPSALAELLERGEVDAALIPVFDLACRANCWQRVSDAGIGSDGRTLTVRVFSKVPAEQMTVLYVDPDSHTSVALARLLWIHVYRRPLRIEPITPSTQLRDCESVLLIGDKVVTTPMLWFDYHVDLGDAWKKWTGLPFVFAAWVTRKDGVISAVADAVGVAHERLALLTQILSDARDRGVARAAEIAAETGPARGWPVPLAVEYMAHALSYTITPAAQQGMNRYFELLRAAEMVPACQ